jgi:hypothetical protein
VKQSGESRSADTLAATKFSGYFRRKVEEEGYDLRDLYNADETGLFWEQLPDRSLCLIREERKSKGWVNGGRIGSWLYPYFFLSFSSLAMHITAIIYCNPAMHAHPSGTKSARSASLSW